MRLKYLDYNILHGGEIEGCFEFIHVQNADIMALQEVFNGNDATAPRYMRTVSELQKLFPSYHHSFAPELQWTYKRNTADIGNMVLSKYPIVSTSITFFDEGYAVLPEKREGNDWSHDPKNMQVCEVDYNGITITVVNLHGIWGRDGKDNERRLSMMKKVVDQVRGKERVIVSGDFNVNEGTETIGMLEKELTNVFQGERKTSFNMRRKSDPGYGVAVVDFIFVSRDIKAIDHSSPDVDFSDHLPLVAELEV